MEWQFISSKSNGLIVKLAKLKDKKYRRAEGLFRFDGIKLFCEAASNDAPVKYVLVSQSASEKYCAEIESYGLDCAHILLSDAAFSKLTDESAPEGVITVCGELSNVFDAYEKDALNNDIKSKTILMLESVRDVGNMGTIIRSARAFGIDMLIISSDCADLYNPKTVRAAMGALFTQNIAIVPSMRDAVEKLISNGARVFAAALDANAKKLGSFPLSKGDAIVIGNEGHGLSADTVNACSEIVFIPMESNSESLNAGIAASICMWELYKTK